MWRQSDLTNLEILLLCSTQNRQNYMYYYDEDIIYYYEDIIIIMMKLTIRLKYVTKLKFYSFKMCSYCILQFLDNLSKYNKNNCNSTILTL